MLSEDLYAAIDKAVAEYYPDKRRDANQCASLRNTLIDIAELALSAMPKWVPVSERLPEDGVNVLCCAISVTHVGEAPQLLRGFLWYAGDAWWHDNGGGPCTYEISHWQPLPTPPQE